MYIHLASKTWAKQVGSFVNHVAIFQIYIQKKSIEHYKIVNFPSQNILKCEKVIKLCLKTPFFLLPF